MGNSHSASLRRAKEMGLHTFMKYLISYREHTLTLTYPCKTKKNVNQTFSKGQLSLLGDGDTWVNKVDRILALHNIIWFHQYPPGENDAATISVSPVMLSTGLMHGRHSISVD